MPKKVLFISYFFPPVGGAGVQRATKFVKYLGEFGWEPTVFTVKNPSVPLFDDSLLLEVPKSVSIIKSKTLEPGYEAKKAVSASAINAAKESRFKVAVRKLLRSIANFLLQPDPQILWYPAARKRGTEIMRLEKFDAIIATAPPFSSLVLGASLAKKFDVPLLLDYRDEWDISNSVWENKNLGKVSLAIQNRMQNFALKYARLVVTTTELSKNTLMKKVENLAFGAEVRCIYNGYDAADFERLATKKVTAGSRYLISYVGTLWNLTSIEPLIQALKLLSMEDPELADQIELAVAGRKTSDQSALLSELTATRVLLTEYEYLDHESALELMDNSDGLCLLLSDLDVAKRVVPAKTFEYFAALNTIICIAPEGELWSLLEDFPRAYCATPSNIEKIKSFLKKDVKRFLKEGKSKVKGFDSSRFERRALAGELANCLDHIAND